MTPDAATIARYMAGMQRSKDKRGWFANEMALYRALLPKDGSDSTGTIEMLCAQAARRVAEAVQQRSAR